MANTSISTRTPGIAPASRVVSSQENPYVARYATVDDANAIDHVVRAAFGSSTQRSSAARDIRSDKTTYIVVTKEFEGSPPDQSADVIQEPTGWQERLRSLFTSSISGYDRRDAVGNIVGLVGIWTAMEQAHIVVIATHPNERRRGVGELLVLATIAEALKSGETNATLEVRKSNTVARSLYHKYGFNEVGIRNRYYHDNREDAIIMSTPSFANLEYKRSLVSRWKGYVSVRGKTKLQLDPTPYLALPE